MTTGVPLLSPPRFTPKRDRKIDVRSAECPTCDAPKGSPCVKTDGTIPTTHLQHPKRRQMAVRADNLARGL